MAASNVAQFDRSGIDRVVALPPDQHTDDKHIENVGADTDGERGCIISEMVVKQAGDPAAGGHASAADQQQRRDSPGGFGAGNSSRTARIYAGMMPEKPSPTRLLISFTGVATRATRSAVPGTSFSSAARCFVFAHDILTARRDAGTADRFVDSIPWCCPDARLALSPGCRRGRRRPVRYKDSVLPEGSTSPRA